MKKLIFTICLLILLKALAFCCSFTWVPFCNQMDYFENAFSGVISETVDNGVIIEVIEVLKGTENKTFITVWDGITGDCNGIPISRSTNSYGVVGDTIIFGLSNPIENIKYDWEIPGDYRKPDNLLINSSIWNAEYKSVENGLVDIDESETFSTTYTYNEFLMLVNTGACFTDENEPQLCDGINDPLSLTWLAELIENADGCEIRRIEQFEYNNSTYFEVRPLIDGENCPFPTNFYNCTGNLVCSLEFGLIDPFGLSEICINLSDASRYSNNIWTYTSNCDEPLQLELVQNAMEASCTDAIYVFDYQGESYVYIDQQCEADDEYDQLYNCSTGVSCPIIFCEPALNEIDDLLNDENKIWSKDIDPYEKYPWLYDLVNPEYCAGKATEYIYSEYYTFVLLTYNEGNSRLYFQDGALYCNGETEYCLSLYNLSEPGNLLFDCTTGNDHLTVETNNFTCTSDGNFTIEVAVNDAIGTPYNGQYGIYNAYGEGLPDFIYFSEGETITYEGNIADASDGLYTVYVYDRNWADDSAQRIEIDVAECLTGGLIFDEYSWLYDLVNPNNCIAGEKVTEYDLGSYSFVLVEDGNEGQLYFQDGTFYCSNTPDYDCLALYGLDNPTANWACENTTEGCLVEDPFSLSWFQTLISDAQNNLCGIKEISIFQYEGSTYFNAVTGPTYPYCPTDIYGRSIYNCSGERICSFTFGYPELSDPCLFDPYTVPAGELIWNYYQDDIFSIYPWLGTLVDPIYCEGSAVNIYAYGDYDFISIENDEGKNLYFQDGTYYCTDSPNYACLELYGLTTSKNEWTCGGLVGKQTTSLTQPKLGFDVDFKIYPNPSNGMFTIDFEAQKASTLIHIISTGGQLIKTLHVEPNQKQIMIDLTGVAKGSYLIQLENSSHTQRIIIQ